MPISSSAGGLHICHFLHRSHAGRRFPQQLCLSIIACENKTSEIRCVLTPFEEMAGQQFKHLHKEKVKAAAAPRYAASTASGASPYTDASYRSGAPQPCLPTISHEMENNDRLFHHIAIGHALPTGVKQRVPR